MTAPLDLAAVRRFTDDLNEQVRRCETGEGTVCADLDQTLSHYVQLCSELRAYIDQWAQAVFSGQLEFDPEIDSVLYEESRRILRRAKAVAARGRALDGECFELENLNALHHHVFDLDFLVDNWVKPRLAVSPAPRVAIPPATHAEIAERLSQMPSR